MLILLLPLLKYNTKGGICRFATLVVFSQKDILFKSLYIIYLEASELVQNENTTLPLSANQYVYFLILLRRLRLIYITSLLNRVQSGLLAVGGFYL